MPSILCLLTLGSLELLQQKSTVDRNPQTVPTCRGSILWLGNEFV